MSRVIEGLNVQLGKKGIRKIDLDESDWFQNRCGTSSVSTVDHFGEPRRPTKRRTGVTTHDKVEGVVTRVSPERVVAICSALLSEFADFEAGKSCILITTGSQSRAAKFRSID